MPDRWVLPDRASAFKWCATRKEQGIRCIFDVLGRYNRGEVQATESYQSYVELITELHRHRVDASIAVKPSTLGGTMNRDTTRRLVQELCGLANENHIGFEIDIEGQRMVDLTLLLAEDLARSGMALTVALQAYLNRTPQDIERMIDAGMRVRLVKGAYTGDISDFNTIAEVYRDLVELIISRDVHFCVATHDPDILEWVQERLPDRDFIEFSFLRGFSDLTKERMASEGWKVTEYVPFGSNKEGYETRRKTYLRRLDELGRQPAP
jgi:proline dehydrogenase